jgi:hypothetical protein
MKKILFSVIAVLCSMHGISQQIFLNDQVTVQLPTGAEKLNKQQIIAFADQKGYERRAMPINPKNVYSINDMLLQLYDFKGDFKTDDLSKQKATNDELFKRHSNYSSYIKSFSNCQVQISKAVSSEKVIYFFSTLNENKTYRLNGILECKKDNVDKADAILYNLLNSIKFEK